MLRLTAVTRRVTAIFDCCHSGTIVRRPLGGRIRGIAPSRLPLAPRPREDPGAPPLSPTIGPAVSPSVGPPRWPYDRSYTLFAACRSHEKAQEIQVAGPGSSHGALVFHLLQTLRESKSEETYRDVFERLELTFRARLPRQHPQLEGAVDRKLFDLEERRPSRFVQISSRDGDFERVFLSGGAVHGVEEGSRWTAYPAGTQVVESCEPVGILEIDSVTSLESQASILEEQQPGAVAAGCRAVETWPGARSSKLGVRLEVDPGLEAQARVARLEIELSRFLEPTADAEDVGVFLLAPREAHGPGHRLPELGTLREPVYAALARDGTFLMPVRPLNRSQALIDLVENLEDLCRWRQALELRPRGPDPLAGRIGLEISRVVEKGKPGSTREEAAFDDGEAFALEVFNHSELELHLYVLYFSSDGEISLIYPAHGAFQPVGPGRSAVTGLEAGDDLFFEVNPEQPFEASGSPVEVTETMKVIATTEATDFLPLFQGSFREIEGSVDSSSELSQLLQRALLGRSPRDLSQPPVAEPVEHWTTLEKKVRIRRRAPAATKIRL